jgi:hypothetical protein
LFNRDQWTTRGLVLEDYMVETNVTTQRYSDLMHDILAGQASSHPPAALAASSSPSSSSSLLLVMIDTEGFDCSIILGISSSSAFFPRFLLFEHNQCGKEPLEQTIQHLHTMGYQLTTHAENMLAWRS